MVVIVFAFQTIGFFCYTARYSVAIDLQEDGRFRVFGAKRADVRRRHSARVGPPPDVIVMIVVIVVVVVVIARKRGVRPIVAINPLNQ